LNLAEKNLRGWMRLIRGSADFKRTAVQAARVRNASSVGSQALLNQVTGPPCFGRVKAFVPQDFKRGPITGTFDKNRD
jgi:hypothetical protein